MSYIAYYFAVRNAGAPVTGLTFGGVSTSPGWTFFKKVGVNASGTGVTLTDATPPTVVEIANGIYAALYNPDTLGEAVGQIDAGSSLSNSDRYIDLCLTASLQSPSAKAPLHFDFTGVISGL